MSPSTPGADPWYTEPPPAELLEPELPAEELEAEAAGLAGAAACVPDEADEPVLSLLLEWPRRATNHTATNRAIAASAI